MKGVYRLHRIRYADALLDPVRIHKEFLDGMNFCHVGCGPNLISFDLYPKYNIFGFDISSVGILKGRLFGYPSRSIVADGEQIFPYRDSVFDYTFGITSMVHLSDWGHYVREMVRITKDGGAIGEIYQNTNSSHWDLDVYRKLREDGEILSRLSELDYNDIENIFEESGVNSIITSTWEMFRYLFRFLPISLTRTFAINLDRARVRRKLINDSDTYFYTSGVVEK